MIQTFLPAVTGPPMSVLLVPPDATLIVLLVPVDDSLVGPVIVHDRVRPIEVCCRCEVLCDDSVRAGHRGAVCKGQHSSARIATFGLFVWL